MTLDYEDPICPDFESTSQNYHRVLEEVMETIPKRERGQVSVMVASHNEKTIKYTVEA